MVGSPLALINGIKLNHFVTTPALRLLVTKRKIEMTKVTSINESICFLFKGLL